MTWLAWATVWWIGLGVALALATQSGAGWRKWWVRVTALLLSLATLDQLGSDPEAANRLVATSPEWVRQLAASLGQGCEGIGVVAQLACPDPLAGAAKPAPDRNRP
jgi:hypothetical protein